MKIINEIYDRTIEDEELKYLRNNTCLLDIETTGFSREINHIYMIGLARLENDKIKVTLLFADKRSEEKDILIEFINYSKDVNRFISFNGLSFDFPFIKSRMNHNGIEYNYMEYEHLDIYKECKKLKDILCLGNLKQKTFESFLGIEREDSFDGGELIHQYKLYEKCNDEECYHNLITHNLEDVQGMVELLIILRYLHITDNIDNSTISEITNTNGEIVAKITTDYNIPKRFVIKSKFYYILFEKNIIKTILKPNLCTLKYYFDNYKNYVHLLNEDIIIPKQLLNDNNKNNAVPCKKSNCCIDVEGLYLPVFDKMLFEDEKLFKENLSSKETYVDISSKLNDSLYLKKYIIHIIKYRLN